MVRSESIKKGASAPSPLNTPLADQDFRAPDVYDAEVTLWVPSLKKNGDPLDHDSLVSLVTEKFLSLYGGATCIAARGAMNLLPGSQGEKVTLVISFTTEERVSQTRPALRELVKWILEAYGKVAVMLRVNDMTWVFRDEMLHVAT